MIDGVRATRKEHSDQPPASTPSTRLRSDIAPTSSLLVSVPMRSNYSYLDAIVILFTIPANHLMPRPVTGQIREALQNPCGLRRGLRHENASTRGYQGVHRMDRGAGTYRRGRCRIPCTKRTARHLRRQHSGQHFNRQREIEIRSVHIHHAHRVTSRTRLYLQFVSF